MKNVKVKLEQNADGSYQNLSTKEINEIAKENGIDTVISISTNEGHTTIAGF